jgi:DNA ligase-associated metallophosphoesterase
MSDRLAIEFAGETLELFAGRALHWPRLRRLLLADLHLGKGDVFRRAGIAVPRGGTSHDLARLEQLLASSQATELFVLGDLLHGPVPDAAWRRVWREWRERHAGVRVAVLAGNHDRRLADADLGVEALPGQVQAGPFLLSHLPPARDEDAPSICGHLHPVVRLEGQRWPCFWRQEQRLVLPAFSAFTGGHALGVADGWLGVCVPGAVVPLGAAPRARDAADGP